MKAAWLGALALMLAAGPVMACEGLETEDGFVRPLMGKRTMTAAYVTLKNPTQQAVTVTGISTPVGRGELHESVQEAGVVKMRHLHHMHVPARGETVLKPGGKHIMIMDVQEALPVGSKVDFTVQCLGGGVFSFSLPVVKR